MSPVDFGALFLTLMNINPFNIDQRQLNCCLLLLLFFCLLLESQILILKGPSPQKVAKLKDDEVIKNDSCMLYMHPLVCF